MNLTGNGSTEQFNPERVCDCCWSPDQVVKSHHFYISGICQGLTKRIFDSTTVVRTFYFDLKLNSLI